MIRKGKFLCVDEDCIICQESLYDKDVHIKCMHCHACICEDCYSKLSEEDKLYCPNCEMRLLQKEELD